MMTINKNVTFIFVYINIIYAYLKKPKHTCILVTFIILYSITYISTIWIINLFTLGTST